MAAKHTYPGHKALSPGIETLISKPGSGIEGERRLPSWSSPANMEIFLSGQSPQEKSQAVLDPVPLMNLVAFLQGHRSTGLDQE